jgi:hypothetical protein
MPLFYFDTRNGDEFLHDEGVDMRSIDEAKAEAVGYLAEAARDHLTPKRDHQELVCTVKDENKKALLRLKLILEIGPP